MMDADCVLRGRRVLIVEDDYFVASDLAQRLEEIGIIIAGPAGTVKAALEIINHYQEQLDGAVLDVNLRGERVYPVAEALAARAIPFLFTTGYDEDEIPAAYGEVPRCEKPIDFRKLTCYLEGRTSKAINNKLR